MVSNEITICNLNINRIYGTEIAVEQANAIIYVNNNATGENDGTSWADAYTDLQDAIAALNDR